MCRSGMTGLMLIPGICGMAAKRDLELKRRPLTRDVNRGAVRMEVREAEHHRRQHERNDDGGRLRALAYKESLHAAITSSQVIACGR